MLTSSDAHAPNGQVERVIFIIMNRGRVYLVDSQLPKRFWPHAAKYTTNVQNRSPAGGTKLLPKDCWQQQTIALDHLQPFSIDVLKARWVFTCKIYSEINQPLAYKARWVAKGYSQIAGLNYNKLYAGVVHKDSFRVLLSLVNHLDMELNQVDITAAFLNGELDE